MFQKKFCRRNSALFSFYQIVEVQVQNVQFQTFYLFIEIRLLGFVLKFIIRIQKVGLFERAKHVHFLLGDKKIGLELCIMHSFACSPSFLS